MSVEAPALASTVPDGAWRDPVPTRALPFWSSLAEDIRAHVSPEQRPNSRWRWLWLGCRILVFSSGCHAVLLYRLGHLARLRLPLLGRLVAGFLFWLGRHWYGCSIAGTARLHGGLILPHPQGIVIGGGVIVGPRSWIFQNVTLGGAPEKAGVPRIGSDARIYAGAVISGPVTLGDHVRVGANVVVWRDVPSESVLLPAQPVLRAAPERQETNPCRE
jgi:serine O-acetyltransferase